MEYVNKEVRIATIHSEQIMGQNIYLRIEPGVDLRELGTAVLETLPPTPEQVH